MADNEECVDAFTTCEKYQQYCGRNSHVTRLCPKTCGKCSANYKAIEEYSVCEVKDNIPDHAKNECLDLNDAECLEAAKVYCDSKDSCFGVTWFEDPMSSGYDNNVVYKMCGSPKTKKMGGFFSTMKKAMKEQCKNSDVYSDAQCNSWKWACNSKQYSKFMTHHCSLACGFC